MGGSLSNIMSIIEITNVTVLNLLKEKQNLANRNLELVKDLEKIEQETNKNAGLVKRIDEKVRPRITKLLPKLGEFEQLSRVFFDKDGKWKMETIDRLEAWKASFKQIEKENK